LKGKEEEKIYIRRKGREIDADVSLLTTRWRGEEEGPLDLPLLHQRCGREKERKRKKRRKFSIGRKKVFLTYLSCQGK